MAELKGYKALQTIYQVAGREKKMAEYRDQYDQLKKEVDLAQTSDQLARLEEEFETEIPDEEAEKITTVQQAIDFVTARQSEG